MLRFTFSIVALSVALGIVCPSKDYAQQGNAGVMIDPAKGYDVKRYNATIWLNRQDTTMKGWVDMKALSLGDLPDILQHAKYLTIDSIFVNGIPASIPVRDSNGTYRIPNPDASIHNGTVFILKTYYHGKGRNEGGINAVSTSLNTWGGVQNMNNMMFSMGVGFQATYVSCTRHWLPCYDEPDDKADTVVLRFFADTSGKAAGAEGIVVSSGLETGHLSGTDNGATNFFEWTVTRPISTYLLTFAFGPFEKISVANPLNVPFDAYSFAKDTAQLRAQMTQRVLPALLFFDSLFGKYPFEKVGYVVAPIGSMEHQTMITLVNSELGVGTPTSPKTTAIHELSHQWWGDRVTCYDFNDPWLNEGFAHFCESLYLERFVGISKYWTVQHSNISSAMGISEDAIPLYGAPFHTQPRNNYPNVIYDKGAAVLGMLRYYLGDSLFFASLHNYGDHFAYETAVTKNLEDELEMTSGKDLRWFFLQWVYGIGHPVMAINWSIRANIIGVHFVQTQDPVKIGYFRMPIIIEARLSKSRTERHEIWMDSLKESEDYFTNSFVPDTIVVDPDGALIKKINGPVKLDVSSEPETDPDPKTELHFMPNPSEDKNTIVYFYSEEAPAGFLTLYLYDSNAKESKEIGLTSPQIDSNKGIVKYYFQSLLTSGTYFASLVLNNKIIAKGKLIITK